MDPFLLIFDRCLLSSLSTNKILNTAATVFFLLKATILASRLILAIKGKKKISGNSFI